MVIYVGTDHDGGGCHGTLSDAGEGPQRPGRYADGGGLHLYISKAGGKSWVQRITIDRRRRDIGLGAFPSVGLAQAREKAADNRAAVAEGRDPVAEKHSPAMPTFREAARAVHAANNPRWRNARHAASWLQTLERHAMPVIGNTPLDRIDRGAVLRVLTPIWTTRPETARRVRQRMRTVFRWGMAHGFMESNPAGEAIDGALAPMPKVKAHLRTLPYPDVSAAVETVAASAASMAAKLCFRFLVLTAARSGEARGATWDEVDIAGQEWRIPSQRMKAGMEHRVPLSRQALDVLGEAMVLRDESGLVFPSPLKAGCAHVGHDADEDPPSRGSGGPGPRSTGSGAASRTGRWSRRTRPGRFQRRRWRMCWATPPNRPTPVRTSSSGGAR